MNSFKAAWTNELLLLLYRRKTVVFLIASILLPVVLVLSLHALQPVLGLIAAPTTFPIELLGIATLVWIPLFLIMTAADLFPHELAARTRKLGLLRPISRFKLYAAKVAALAVGLAALLVILAMVTTICTLIASPLQDAQATGWGSDAKAYLAAYLAMLALGSLFVFVAQLFKSASGFLIVALVLYAAAKLAPFVYEPFVYFSPTSYTNWHQLWLSNTIASGRLLDAGLFLLASFVLFFTLGYTWFDRKDV